MRAKKLHAADVSSLVECYVDAAIAQVEARDPRKGNKAHDIVAGVYRELRSRGESAQRALLPLLKHNRLGVQLWAAAHALEFAPDQGVPVLESIAKRAIGSIGMSRYSAEKTLEQWKKGELKFP